MSALPTLAVASATGNVGAKITSVILQPEFRKRFREVVVLTRLTTSSKAQALANSGASLRVYDEKNLAAALEDVDVVINTVGAGGHSFKEALVRSLPQTRVKLYFPSELGVNHYLHDFEYEVWDAKKAHYKLAKELNPHITIYRVYIGNFTEESIGPCLFDAGKALAILASSEPSKVPAEVYLEGDSRSMNQIADIMMRAGSGPIEVSSIPLEQYKKDTLSKPLPTPERHLRFLMGEGKIDHSHAGLGNHNALVERDPDFGKWKSIQDLADETHGCHGRNPLGSLQLNIGHFIRPRDILSCPSVGSL